MTKYEISGSVKQHTGDSWGKSETQTLEVGNLKFFCTMHTFTKWQPFFNFFIIANEDIPFPSTLRKSERVNNLKIFHMRHIYEMAVVTFGLSLHVLGSVSSHL